MKKSLPYEIIAALLGLFGAFFLVCVYMPLINPEQTKLDTHQDLPSLGYYIIMTPIASAILLASWFFNRKAQQLKQEQKYTEKNRHRKLKWVLLLAVILFFVIGFSL